MFFQKKFWAALLLLPLIKADAIVLQNDASEDRVPEQSVEKSTALNCALQSKCADVAEFPYWEHVGMVGMGSGIYLGNGWVLTSAHVGCHPFKMSDGSHYRPSYDTWRVLQNPDGGKADLAVFRVQIEDGTSSLAKLGSIPVGQIGKTGVTPLVMIGTGFIEKKNPFIASGSRVVLGYHVQSQREKRWAFTSLDKVLDQPAATAGGSKTRCFVSSFRRTKFEGQAADGDSGGAMFAYDAKRGCWELVGCIFAVSQLGTYVPYGARTYFGELDSYRSELPVIRTAEVAMAR